MSSNGDPASASSVVGYCQCDTVAGHAKAGAGSRQIRGVIARKQQSEQGSTNRAAMGWGATRGSEPEDGLDAAERDQAASSTLAGDGSCWRDSEEIDGVILCQSSLENSWTFSRRAAGDKLSPSL